MKNKVIKAWWWRDKVNLGDTLTPYIIEKLSCIECKHIGIKWSDAILYILKCIYARKTIKWHMLFPVYFREPIHILGVGSILGHKSRKKAIAWGSGFITGQEFFTGKLVVAVRGRLSAAKLMEFGHPKVSVFGDPALLLPLIHKNEVQKNRTLALVPNFSEYNEFKTKYGDMVDIIDLNTGDIEGAIDTICSYRYVLSTSLHGLIICHAYGVPAIWIEKTVLVGDNFHFKFRDYFSSVGIEYYDPYRDIESILHADIPVFFKENKEKYLIKEDLHEIQQKLLSVAPFPVLQKFKD